MKILLIFFRIIFIFLLFLSFQSCKKEQKQEQINFNESPNIKFEKFLDKYEIIWGMDFLPNGDMIFGEKRGRLYIK